MNQRKTYGQRYGGRPSGRSKIDEAKRRRGVTDNIMSPLWVLSPLLGGAILGIALFISFSFLFTEQILGGTAAFIMIGVGIIAWAFFVAYPWYLMIKRRTKHFKRDHLLMEGVIEYFEEKQSQSEVDLTQELATLRSILAESLSEESEKNPILYTILALVIPWIGILYVLYFLMKDIYSHHQRVAAFMENTRIASNKLGKSLVVPSWKTLEKRNFVVYFLISCVCGLFMYYWMYSIIKDYNEHFKNQWRFEDQLPSRHVPIGGRQGTQGGQGVQYSRQKDYHQRTQEQGPSQQQQSSPQYYQRGTRRKQCPDCRYQMRYIEEYDKWFCDKCQSYKILPPEKQQPSQQQIKNHCTDCGSKMRYIEEYDRWYCDNCKKYK
ncbi:MAG: hypothetical protein R6W73_02260 [Candidatus Saliniplasma sp.]